MKSFTEETKKKMSEANRGEKNPMYGRKHSEETRKKMATAKIGKPLSEETKRKISESKMKELGGLRHYNSNIYQPIMRSLEQRCSLCGTTEKLITHHIDGNYKNNVLSNITIVCKGCHNKIHKTKVGGD